ncbi:hypothetical protein EJB05_56188, partial [Eragrostis curvula]
MEQGDQHRRRRDWSLLPPDLTALILTTLELPELLNAAAVCRAWRAAYKADPRLDAAPLFRAPCLVFHAGDDPASQTATLLSLADGGRRVHYRVSLPDPPFPTRYVMGSSHGWLATADERSDLLLVNPVTRAQVRLPPIGTLTNVTCRVRRGVLRSYRVHNINFDGFQSFKPDEGRIRFYEKVVWSSNPTSGNCIVMIIHAPKNIISFARVGDTRWSLLHVDRLTCQDYEDFFYNGEDALFYAIRSNSEVHTINLHGPFPTVKVIFKAMVLPIHDYKYIVRAPWADVLQVRWYDDFDIDDDNDARTTMIAVYKMDFVEQKIVQVKDLRGYALFLGFNISFFFLPTEDCSVIKQNRIYHADDLIDYDYTRNIYAPRPRHMVEVNLEDGSVNDVWPSPNSWSNWPPPVWLMPSFSQ